MKKTLSLLTLLFLGTTVYYAQVGIQTNNPQGAFHVDGAKDNPLTGTPTAVQQANDVTITATGNVGVGTTSPADKLDIAGSISVSPTTAGASNVKFFEAAANGTNKITVKAPENVAADRTITLPANAPVNGYALLTDTAGNTSWGAVSPSAATLASIALLSGASISTGASVGTNTDFRFFQTFDQKITDPNNAFNLSTGTYTAAQAVNYLITAYIVPNSAPDRNTSGFYYPVNLEIRKNITPNNPNTGINIMDASTIKYATPGQGGVRYSVGLSGMVTFAAGDRLNAVVYLNGTSAGAAATGGVSFPVNFTYAVVADYKAVFSVTAL